MKQTIKVRPKHCGFEVEPPFPVKPYPEGTTFIRNADGTYKPVLPKDKKEAE